MNTEPPNAIAHTTITVNISNISSKIMNNIMQLHSPFIREYAKIADKS